MEVDDTSTMMANMKDHIHDMKTTLILALSKSKISASEKHKYLLKLKNKEIAWKDFQLHLQGRSNEVAGDSVDIDISSKSTPLQSQTVSNVPVSRHKESTPNDMSTYSLRRQKTRRNTSMDKENLLSSAQKAKDASSLSIAKALCSLQKAVSISLDKSNPSSCVKAEGDLGVETVSCSQSTTDSPISLQLEQPYMSIKTGSHSEEESSSQEAKSICPSPKAPKSLPSSLKIAKPLNSQYQCNKCEKYFTSPDNLSRHEKLARHNKKVIHTCNICNAAFARIDNLRHHIKVQHSPDYIKPKCDICKDVFSSSSHLKRHKLALHMSDRALKHICKICEKTFADKYSLVTHLKRTHINGKSLFKCDECLKVFKNMSKLKRHSNVHAENKYYCKPCNKSFSRKDHLHRHKLDCCDKSYARTDLKKSRILKARRRTRCIDIVKEEGKYVCQFCQQTYTRREHLLNHFLKQHKDSIDSNSLSFKTFQCDICSYEGTIKTKFTAHMMMHTGERPYTCTFCPQSFVRKDALSSHERIHTDVAKVKCKQCNQVFTRLDLLKRHNRQKHNN